MTHLHESGTWTVSSLQEARPDPLRPVQCGPGLQTRRSACDAHVAFCRPVLDQKGNATGAIVERMDAGESVTGLAEDNDLSTEEIMEAVLYERAASVPSRSGALRFVELT